MTTIVSKNSYNNNNNNVNAEIAMKNEVASALVCVHAMERSQQQQQQKHSTHLSSKLNQQIGHFIIKMCAGSCARVWMSKCVCKCEWERKMTATKIVTALLFVCHFFACCSAKWKWSLCVQLMWAHMSVFTLIQTIHLNVTRKPLKDCVLYMQPQDSWK